MLVQLHTSTLTHAHMRIHLPDLADPFPCSGRWGIHIFFPSPRVMCCFLASQRLYYFVVGGSNDGGSVSISTTAGFGFRIFPFVLFFPLLSFSLHNFFCPSVLLCSSLNRLPSLSWHLLSGSLIILFFRVLIRILLFPLFLSPSLSFALSFSLPLPCFCPSDPPPQPPLSNIVSF